MNVVAIVVSIATDNIIYIELCRRDFLLAIDGILYDVSTCIHTQY